jgi:hypothetical protein
MALIEEFAGILKSAPEAEFETHVNNIAIVFGIFLKHAGTTEEQRNRVLATFTRLLREHCAAQRN